MKLQQLRPGPQRLGPDGPCPGLLPSQLPADAGAGDVRQMALPPQRGQPHPPHPVRVPRRPPAAGCPPRTGRRQLRGGLSLHPAPDPRRQPLYPAARPRPAGPVQRFLRLIAPSCKTIIVKEFES